MDARVQQCAGSARESRSKKRSHGVLSERENQCRRVELSICANFHKQILLWFSVPGYPSKCENYICADRKPGTVHGIVFDASGAVFLTPRSR